MTAANNTLFAYVCNDRGQGDEIVACIVPGMGIGPVPMVFANERVARLVHFIAVEHAKGKGVSVRFVKFTKREILETITP